MFLGDLRDSVDLQEEWSLRGFTLCTVHGKLSQAQMLILAVMQSQTKACHWQEALRCPVGTRNLTITWRVTCMMQLQVLVMQRSKAC